MVEEAFDRKAVSVSTPAERPNQYYGELVFNRGTMFKYLPADIYTALVDAIENKKPISRNVADAVASGMRQWAIEHGARHYTHWFAPLTGGTAEKHDYDNFWVGRDIMMNNDLPYLGLTTGGDDGTAVYLDNTLTHRATAGFFGRVNYDYKGIYLFEANIRRDGSSSFPADDQWAWFPSFSAGYRFTEEPYFQPIKATNIITNGKIRASYGHIGNEAVGDYRFLSTINNLVSSNVHWLNSGGTKVGMMTTPTLVSSNLTWERVITTDVGLDLGFFNNSLNLTFDWFQRDTKDMLTNGASLPAVYGASVPKANCADLRTRGWEIALMWDDSVDLLDSPMKYSVSVGVGDYVSRITKFR